MEEKILACDNDICKLKDECKRHKLYEDGAKEYKTHSGKPNKGCGKFIPLNPDKK